MKFLFENWKEVTTEEILVEEPSVENTTLQQETIAEELIYNISGRYCGTLMNSLVELSMHSSPENEFVGYIDMYIDSEATNYGQYTIVMQVYINGLFVEQFFLIESYLS